MSGTPGMKHLPKDRANYARFLQLFRNRPGAYSAVARSMGCGEEMAKRVYTLGWPTPEGWARPIIDVLREETEEARKQQQAKKNAHEAAAIEEAEQARARGIEARVEEERIVQISRKEVLNFNAIAISLVPAMKKLAEGITAQIMTGKYAGDPVQAFKFLREFSLLLQRGLQAAAMAIELSRLDNGRPTLIVEEVMSWDPQKCEQEIQEAMEALERARARGIVPTQMPPRAGGGSTGPNGKPVIDAPVEAPKPKQAPRQARQLSSAQALLSDVLDDDG